jgi:hypothetical protein
VAGAIAHIINVLGTLAPETLKPIAVPELSGNLTQSEAQSKLSDRVFIEVSHKHALQLWVFEMRAYFPAPVFNHGVVAHSQPLSLTIESQVAKNLCPCSIVILCRRLNGERSSAFD